MTEEAPRKFTPQAFTADQWEKLYYDAAAKSEDWSKRFLTSLAVANAAGVVAIASTLPEAGDPAQWQLRSAQAFGIGIVCAGFAMVLREKHWGSLAFRFAWLARNPERFEMEVAEINSRRKVPLRQRLTFWRQRKEELPTHPGLKSYWTARRWGRVEQITSYSAALAFIVGLAFALWLR